MNLTLQSLLAPAIIIIVVVVINVSLFYGLRSKNTREQIDILRKAGRSARNPWMREEEKLEELSQKVSRLKQPENHETSPGSEDKQG